MGDNVQVVFNKISKALRGSWELPDARAIDAAIERGGGAHKSNYAFVSALSSSIYLLFHQDQKKRGLGPSRTRWRAVASLNQLVLVGQRVFRVKEAPAIATTQMYIAIRAVKISQRPHAILTPLSCFCLMPIPAARA